MTTREPEWNAEDRAIIYALLDLQADTCNGCGERLSESLHVDGRPDPVYSSHYLVCMGCLAKDRAVRKLDQQDAATEKAGGVIYRAARRLLLKRHDGGQ